MSPSFARIAPTYDALRPLSAEDRARLEAMLREAAVGAGDLVVEVGWGTGRLTLPMAGLITRGAVGVGSGTRPRERVVGEGGFGPGGVAVGGRHWMPVALWRAEVREEVRRMEIADVVDRVRGRYISTLAMLPPLEYRLGLQRLEEMLAQDRTIALSQRSEWAIITARK